MLVLVLTLLIVIIIIIIIIIILNKVNKLIIIKFEIISSNN